VRGLRAQWGSSTAPASGRTPNASRSRRRRGWSRQRMDCGGLPPPWELGQRRSRAFNGMQWRRIEGGAPGFRAGGKQLRAGNGGPSGGIIQRSTEGGWTFGGRESASKGGAVGRRRRAARSLSDGSSARGSSGVRLGTKHDCVWTPSGTTSAGICPSPAPAPICPKTEMRPELAKTGSSH